MSASAFYQLAGKQIKELVKPYGFKKNGRFFYRITEEGVVQQFCLLWSHGDFTVRFYLSSVYGYNGRNIEGTEISELMCGSINQWLSDPQFGYQMDSENRKSSAANICAQAIEDILLPFFESHKDPHTARNFVIEHDPRVAGGIDKYDIREMGLYLCMEDFTSVQNYLTYCIENHHQYNKRWWETVEQEYRQLLNAIRRGDSAYVLEYMENKKKETYAEYKWKDR